MYFIGFRYGSTKVLRFCHLSYSVTDGLLWPKIKPSDFLILMYVKRGIVAKQMYIGLLLAIPKGMCCDYRFKPVPKQTR
jgi:hypothetical protein